MEIRKIPEKFTANQYKYALIKRTPTLALYRGVSPKGGITWEVHKVRFKSFAQMKFKALDGSIRVVDLPDREVLASNEEFGTHAFSYNHEENALKKFDELSKLNEVIVP